MYDCWTKHFELVSLTFSFQSSELRPAAAAHKAPERENLASPFCDSFFTEKILRRDMAGVGVLYAQLPDCKAGGRGCIDRHDPQHRHRHRVQHGQERGHQHQHRQAQQDRRRCNDHRDGRRRPACAAVRFYDGRWIDFDGHWLDG